jgi:threonine/homoserine/homoserine lactone efflux protein
VGSVLLYVLPLGLAVAISVFPTLAAIFLLLGARPVPAGVGYAAGWSIGLLALVTCFALSARLLPSGGDRMPTWAHIVEIVLGVLLVAFGAFGAVRDTRREKDPDAAPPGWMTRVAGLGPGKAFGFGVLMNLRPKNITVTLAAGLAIGTAALPLPDGAIAILIFTIIGVSVVLGIVLSYLFGRKRVRPMLRDLSTWLLSHSSVVLHVSLAAIGLILVVLGISHLVSGS